MDDVCTRLNISRPTLIKIEADEPVMRENMLKVCAMPELRLIPPHLCALPTRQEIKKIAPNFYMSPGFDAIQMASDLTEQLASPGGTIEQTHMYLDPQSAMDWVSLCQDPAYRRMFRDSFPYVGLARRLRELSGDSPLDLIALGPGDGNTEVRVTQTLLTEFETAPLDLYLLDASPPLLNRAFNHARNSFADEKNRVAVYPIQGNFHHLSRYAQLRYSAPNQYRRRIFMMLGNTLANIESEPAFIQSAFSHAVPGDVLVLDVDHAYTKEVHSASAIRAADPGYAKPMSEGHRRWLSGPILRNCPEHCEIDLEWRPDTERPIQGSYGSKAVATIAVLGQPTKEFIVFQIRRYDVNMLSQSMGRMGWTEMGRLDFAGSARPRALLVFQRQ